MIRVVRSAEPPSLTTEREARLPNARTKLSTGVALVRADLAGYRAATDDLYAMQHRKCAYCEDSTRLKFDPVEHFRPALKAQRGDGFTTDGYWWLVWTWTNLLYSCPICNTSHKRDAFPLVAGSTQLTPEEQPPGAEQAVLVDPSDPREPDPMDLIQFIPVGDRWIPTGRDGDPRGTEIVRILGLAEAAHLPRYKDHVREYLQEHIDALAALEIAGDLEGFRARFADAAREARPVRRWAGLCFDVLDYYWPETERARLGVPLARP